MNSKLAIDLAKILERKYPHGFHAPADIDISTFVEFADDDWTHELDLKQLLAEDHRIALIYSVDDVKTVRSDLDDKQAWDVLRQLEATCQQCPDPLHQRMRKLADLAYPNGKLVLRDRLQRLLREVDALPRREHDNPAAYGEAAAKIDALEAALEAELKGE